VSPRILFVCRRPPWPLDNGARIRSHRLLEGVARRFDTTLLTMQHHPDSPDGRVDLDELQQALPDVAIEAVDGLGASKRLHQLRSLISTDSWSFGRYRTAAFRRAIAQRARELDVQMVHADDLGAALALPDRSQLPQDCVLVYASHNIESRILDGDARASAGFRRRFAWLDSRKLRREERSVWNRVDLNLAVSEHDLDEIRARTAVPAELCPNGTDPVESASAPPGGATGTLRLLFVGSGSYAPYERGLAWFADAVMPTLRQRHDVVLDVVGRPPHQPSATSDVVHRGYVDDLRPWYEGADAVVVPVFEGSGTRLKLVEAAEHARPIVTTSLGAQGLPLEPDVHYLRAETADEFVRAIDRIADGTGTTDLVDRARRAVQPLLWPRITDELCDRYRTLFDSRAPARP